jgi:uncharacterized protein
MAASEGHADVVRELLAKGADPSARDRNSWTALMWATSMRHTEVVDMLKARPKK